MKDNVVFNFDANIVQSKEDGDETTTEIIRTLLSNIPWIYARGMFIPVAHRIGSKKGNNRAVIVNSDNEAKLVDDKLFVKGKLQTKFLPPVLPLPTMDISTLKLQKGDTISDSGSFFMDTLHVSAVFKMSVVL